MRYYFIPARMAVNKKTDSNKCWWGCGGVMPHHTHTLLWWECKMMQSLRETLWKFLKKLKHRIIIWPSNCTLDIYLWDSKSYVHTRTYFKMFIIVLFLIAKGRNKHMPINLWTDKQNYLAFNRNGFWYMLQHG